MISLGRAPVRIEILNEISGVDFEEAWARRNSVELDGLAVNFISRTDLIVSKLASGRPQDLADVESLRRSEPD